MTAQKYPSWTPASERRIPEPASAPILTGWGGNRPGTSRANVDRRTLKERDKAAAPTTCREVVPVCERPVWNPAKDRAWVAVMERLDQTRGVISMGRK